MNQRGFTLIELIMVVVILGVLAIYAAPRMFNSGDFYARGFHDETLALLRYAQKTAIAQRRPVCIAFTVTDATLTVDADKNAGTGTNGCELDLDGSNGDTPARVMARGNVTYNNVPSAFSFDGLGQPSAGQTWKVTGMGSNITVEVGTGYVHD